MISLRTDIDLLVDKNYFGKTNIKIIHKSPICITEFQITWSDHYKMR